MFSKILSIVPSWVWVVLAILVAAGTVVWVVNKIDAQASAITTLQENNKALAEANKTQKDEIDRLTQDAKDKSVTSNTIAEGSQQAETDYSNLDDKLKAAIAERDAIEAAIEGTQAISGSDAPITTGGAASPPTQAVTATVKKPVMTQAQIDKDARELDIAWEAFCLNNTNAQCKSGTSP